jgi:osmotically-inducible protein OsmY
VHDAWVAGTTSVDAEGLQIEWARRDAYQERTYRARTDQEITQAVRQALRYDPRVRGFQVDIEAKNGEVLLTGVVDNLAAKQAAREDAVHTAGVWRVRNQLRVRPGERVADKEMVERVERALSLDPYIEPDKLSIRAQNQKVYLDGRVDSQFERSRAAEVAARINGVAAVQNNLTVARVLSSTKSDWEIERDIRDRIWWSAVLDTEDMENISVSVQAGTAILEGTVDNPMEREEALEAARKAGAQKVLNRLKVRRGAPENKLTGR